MGLREIKPSITSMTLTEAMDSIHREIRKSRLIYKPRTTKAKSTRVKAAKKTKAITKDKDQLRELLRMMGEDV